MPTSFTCSPSLQTKLAARKFIDLSHEPVQDASDLAGAECGTSAMKSERLTRKTHLKRLHVRDVNDCVRPSGPRVYDLTHSNGDAVSLLSGSSTHETNFSLRVVPCFWPMATLMADANQLDLSDLVAYPARFENDRDILVWCAGLAGESPLVNALMNDAEDYGWTIGLDQLGREGYYIDVAERLILIDRFALEAAALGRSAFFRNALLTTFIRALRDVWHENRLEGSEDYFAPDQYLMLERIRAADCDTVTMLAGWELRGAGFTEVWRHILGSEEGDMASVFTRFLERDPGALFNGAALAYTFRQWYADTARVDASDHETLEVLDDVYMGADGALAMEFGEARVTPAVIEGLAILPDGTAYLSGLGEGILKDPFFAGLNDEINQTHLFHIMYDLDMVMVHNVPFRDAELARLIFPDGDLVRPATPRG